MFVYCVRWCALAGEIRNGNFDNERTIRERTQFNRMFSYMSRFCDRIVLLEELVLL